ncbi:MAG: hypothetical protein JXR95_00080 [Deltaproteobacteria bacterium]|nr:hypothetical protein [Deltaproteobacteria bacterium]
MLRTDRTLFLFISTLFLLFTSCDGLKGPDLRLYANPESIAAGGNDYTEITAFLQIGGDPSGAKVIEFETTNGSFAENEELDTITGTTDSEGNAIVKLYSSIQQGQAVVTAKYYDDDSGEETTKSITVEFGPPSASSLPMAGNFNLDCDYSNVGGFVSISTPDVRVPCEITARSVKNERIPPESLDIEYYAEAGQLVGELDEYGTSFEVTYYVRGGSDSPLDVDPLSGEDSRPCSGKTCNPRDGLVTLLVCTKGSEPYVDDNDNGMWDEGEDFTDMPEPFLDKNDNGKWDEGEPFCSNNNSTYDEENGYFDGETMIGAVFKILWTGVPEENETASFITHSPSSTDLADGGSFSVTVRLVDKNLNPVASFPDGYDTLTFVDSLYGLSPTSPVSNPGTIYPINQMGMTFDSEWRFLEYDATAADYTVNFADASPQSTSESHFLIGIGALLSPGPEGEYGEYEQYTFDFLETIQGTVQ